MRRCSMPFKVSMYRWQSQQIRLETPISMVPDVLVFCCKCDARVSSQRADTVGHGGESAFTKLVISYVSRNLNGPGLRRADLPSIVS